MKLVRVPGGQYQYQYKCATPSTAFTSSRNVSTNWNNEGEGNAMYLDRHNIQCNSDEKLSQLHLTRDGKGNYRYDYTCNK